MPPKPGRAAARYRRDDDDDDGDDGADAALMLFQQKMSSRPVVCMVLELPDEEVLPEPEVEAKKADREGIIAKLRALNLDVEQLVNKKGDKLVLMISCPRRMLEDEAQARKLRVRLNEEKYGGAWCEYNKELDRRDAYVKSVDECDPCSVLSSLWQLEITDRVITSIPFDDGSGEAEALDPDKLKQQGKILAYFYLHYERTRMLLGEAWAGSSNNWKACFAPQPLDEIKEYFGEQIALYFTWLGFYISMLWLPGLVGVFLSASKTYYGASDTPWVSLYGILVSVWAMCVPLLWRRLEATKRYEWDTVDFKDSEDVRLAFMLDPSTEKGTHRNVVTGEIDEYYFDEGTYLPPRGRSGRCLFTFLFILALDVLSAKMSIWIYATWVHPLLKPGDEMGGSLVGGCSFALMSEVFNFFFRLFSERLIEWENWRTETEHEDARILRLVMFNGVNKYFCFVLVAFLVNHVEFGGRDLKCPEYQCMPVLHTMLMVHFSATLALQIWLQTIYPWAKRLVLDCVNDGPLEQRAKAVVRLAPYEQQMEHPRFGGVIDKYQTFIFQFGYISCFTVALPIAPLIAVATNIYLLRTHAATLLQATQRPPWKGASDIGAWQYVLDAIATLAIITNSLIIGLTSHSLYFYFPEMTMVQRYWAVVFLEHTLFCIKVLIENASWGTDKALDEYERRNAARDRHWVQTFRQPPRDADMDEDQ